MDEKREEPQAEQVQSEKSSGQVKQHAERLKTMGVDPQNSHQIADLISKFQLNAEVLFKLVERYGPSILQLIKQLFNDTQPQGGPDNPSPQP